MPLLLSVWALIYCFVVQHHTNGIMIVSNFCFIIISNVVVPLKPGKRNCTLIFPSLALFYQIFFLQNCAIYLAFGLWNKSIMKFWLIFHVVAKEKKNKNKQIKRFISFSFFFILSIECEKLFFDVIMKLNCYWNKFFCHATHQKFHFFPYFFFIATHTRIWLLVKIFIMKELVITFLLTHLWAIRRKK